MENILVMSKDNIIIYIKLYRDTHVIIFYYNIGSFIFL